MNKFGTQWGTMVERKQLVGRCTLPFLFCLLVGLTWVFTPPSSAADSPPGPQLIKVPCASCPGGYYTVPASPVTKVSVSAVVEQPSVAVKHWPVSRLRHRVIHCRRGAMAEVLVVRRFPVRRRYLGHTSITTVDGTHDLT